MLFEEEHDYNDDEYSKTKRSWERVNHRFNQILLRFKKSYGAPKKETFFQCIEDGSSLEEQIHFIFYYCEPVSGFSPLFDEIPKNKYLIIVYLDYKHGQIIPIPVYTKKIFNNPPKILDDRCTNCLFPLNLEKKYVYLDAKYMGEC